MAEKTLSKEELTKINQLHKRAVSTLDRRQYDYAITLFKSILSIDPRSKDALEGIKLAASKKMQKASPLLKKKRSISLLVGCFLAEKRGKWKLALERFENLLAVTQPPSQLLPHIGDVYMNNDILDNAAAAYNAALRVDNDNVYCLRRLGKIYIRQNLMQEAKSVYDKLSKLAGTDGAINREVKDAYALITIDKGRWEEEGSFRKKRVSGEGEPGAAAHAEDNEQSLLSRLAEAKVKAEASAEPALQGQLLEAYKQLAGFYGSRENTEKAIAVGKEIVGNVGRGDLDSHLSLAHLLLKERYFEEAASEYEAAVSIDSTRADIFEILGGLYVRREKTDLAIQSYEKALITDNQNLDVLRGLLELYIKQDLRGKAGSLCERILKISPGDAVAGKYAKEITASSLERDIKELTYEVKKLDDALKAEPGDAGAKEKLKEATGSLQTAKLSLLRSRIEKEPNNLSYRHELGLLYWEMGEVDKALSSFQLSVKSEDKRTNALQMMGLCFERKGMLDLARSQLQSASDAIQTLNETKKAILYDLGRVYEKMGEGEASLSEYKKIYEVDIDYRDVAEKIEKAYKK